MAIFCYWGGDSEAAGVALRLGPLMCKRGQKGSEGVIVKLEDLFVIKT
jgi:hypothetical protein